MGALDMLMMAVTHPDEFRILLQFWNFHEPKRDITNVREHETSGWDRETMRKCWELLDHSSRSFAAVIKELDGDLARVICLFYLVLRGLDTIEDDMTIPDSVKQPLLRSFHETTVKPGWNFDGCGPDERDRVVLVEYANVVTELLRLEPSCRNAIVGITQKMATGMADFAHRAAESSKPLAPRTVADYDLYCHYVAGLVGEGLSALFAATGKESAFIAAQLSLSNSMGILLQKTNIIRDIHEDVEQRRLFWPQEIWGRAEFGCGRGALDDVCRLVEDSERDRAAWVQSAMVADALRHAPDALDYLRLLKNQSVFNFAAIPAAMALATLDLCFMNPEMFRRNIKIRKAHAANLIMRATNPREVAYMFRDYARSIHAKASPADPNFLRVSVACCKIEQWAEHHYPSFVSVSASATRGPQQVFNARDARSRVAKADQAIDQVKADEKRRADIRANVHASIRSGGVRNTNESQGPPWDVLAFMIGAVLLILGLSVGVVYAALWYFD